MRITVLDLPTIGTDREDAWARVERLRGRTAAAAYAERTHAGTVADQRDRWGGLAELGVDTVFLALADLEGAEDVGGSRSSTRDGFRRLADETRLGRSKSVVQAGVTGCRSLSCTCSSVLDSPSTRRATISCWICWVPSKMSRILESRAHFSSSSASL